MRMQGDRHRPSRGTQPDASPPHKSAVSGRGDAAAMDHGRIGRSIRVVRIRRRIRQADLAALVGLSQPTISRIERGRIGGVTVDTLERVFEELGIRASVQMWWDGAELDRLLGGRHSAMHEAVARLFEGLPGWVTAPEVSFAIYRERGVIDILAWHAASRSLLVIELKTELVDVQETVGTLDRKRRLAAQIAAERGWKPTTVSAWLVIAEGRTQRASGRGASRDAAYRLPGRRADGPRLAPGAVRIDRGDVVPAFDSWHECEAGVRPGSARQRPAAERGGGSLVPPSTPEASAGRSARAPTPPTTRVASAWRGPGSIRPFALVWRVPRGSWRLSEAGRRVGTRPASTWPS